MATIMTHALVAGTAYKLSNTKKKLVLTLCIIGSILPDADVIGFAYGIKYGDMLGHRGFTHSILFAIAYGLVCLLFFLKEQQKFKLFTLFTFSSLSHGLLDMLTNGGLGVGLFIPFTGERYFFPIKPIEVSPIGPGFFSQRGIDVMMSEFKLIVIPCLIILLIHFLVNKIRAKN